MHPTSSVSATKVVVAPQTVLTTPTYPTPIDKDFFKDMSATYTNTMKTIEDIIEKKLVKMDKKNQQERDDENKDEAEDLVEDDVQNF
jgi:hypothetical protein